MKKLIMTFTVIILGLNIYSQSVFINPATQTVNTSEIFTTTVEVSNVQNLGGYILQIDYNPLLLQANSLTLGSFLGSTGRILLPLNSSIDNTNGLIEYAISTVGPVPPGPDGNGILLTIEWESTSSLSNGAIADLALQNVQLTETDGSVISASIQSAIVNIIGDPTDATNVLIDPSSQTVNTSEVFSTIIDIEDAANLGSFLLNLDFDADLLQANSLTLGNFLASTGRTVVPITNTIDNTTGTIDFEVSTTGAPLGPDGDGTLLTIEWTSVNSLDTETITDLLLNFVQLKNIYSVIIPRSVQNATVTVLEGPISGTDVFINPNDQNVTATETFTTTVEITDVVNFGGYSFDIDFDAALLQANSATIGSFLGSTGRTVTTVTNNINNTTGSIDFEASTTGATPAGPNGDGTLLTIEWTANNTYSIEKIVDLLLQNLVLTDTDGAVISRSFSNATVHIAGDPNASTDVYLNPVHTDVLISEIFTTTLEISNVANLGGFEVTISFDESLLQANSVTLGSFLGSSGRMVLPLQNAIDNANGLISNAYTTIGANPPGPDGDGLLLTIEWTAIDVLASETTTDIILQNVQVTEPNASVITFSSQDATVTISPCTGVLTATCQDITVELDENGETTISANQIDNGSAGDCGIASMSVSPDNFDCNDIGDNTVSLTVIDNAGNTETCTANVTVEDNTNPTAICQDITVALNSSGLATITTNDIDNGSSDACGISSMNIIPSAFDCEDIGNHTVTLFITDNNNNSSSCQATVTVVDNTDPIAICQDIIIELDANGAATIATTDIDNGSSDNCSFTLSADKTSFNCNDVGENTVSLTATDGSNNTASCQAIITVEDNIDPIALCQNIIIELDANGAATITTADIDNGSSDNCSFTLSADKTSFNCDDLGENTVTLTVTDGSNNTATCQAIITVEDNIDPMALCQDITIELDTDGLASISTADIDNGSGDNCSFTLSADKTSFNCDDIGENTITLTATDGSNNTATCQAIITIEDNTDPTAICQNIIIELDANGAATITTADIDNGSSDNCSFTLSADKTNFNCNDVGENTVTLTATDGSNNTATCQAIITVEDNIDPIALCQNIIIELDANGAAAITTANIDNGSSDNCSFTLSADKTSFNCDDLGENTVTLTANDGSNNTATCQAIITVEDNIDPIALCQDITIELDTDGLASISTADIDNGSGDNCSFTLSANKTSFNCDDIGENTVTLTATDGSNNTATCQAIVTVEDNISPIALCKDITIELNTDGVASIVAADIDNGSSDNCSFTLTTSQYDFTCTDIGENVITLTVTDSDNNSSSCLSTITVEDNLLATILISPITQTVNSSSIFTTTVDITDVVNLAGFSLNLDFDASKLQANSVTLESFLGSSGRTVVEQTNTIDNNNGLIEYTVNTTGETPAGPNGNGTLITIEWVASSEIDVEETTNLILQNLQTSHPNGNTFCINAQNAEVILSPCFIYDFDCDCDVDILDVTAAAYYYGTVLGDSLYNSDFDFDDDGDCDILDITTVTYYYGWSCSD